MLSGTTRDAVRERYRRVVVRSCLTHNLIERAGLQAAARRFYAAMHASGFEGAAIVLLCEGDDTYSYDDGDTAPLHCTICFLGNAADMAPDQRSHIVDVTGQISDYLTPFDAPVVSAAKFGGTPVRLVEHGDIDYARTLALADPTVDALASTYEDHPHYLPHVSGLDDRETVRFDRIAALLGGDDHVFPLGTPYQPPQTSTLTLTPTLDMQTQGVMT